MFFSTVRFQHGKNSALFRRFSGFIAYLEDERYTIHNLLDMTLISLLAALSLLFIVTL
jgi:hypothetical protein